MPNLTNVEIKQKIKNFEATIESLKVGGIPFQKIENAKLEFIRENPPHVPSPKAIKKLEELITKNDKMLSLKDNAALLASYDDPVLIIGESGTGKEIIAQALHGERRGDCIAINCAGLPEYLVESELFGHKRGAFTGAEYEKEGLFRAAQDGTLFLDEIGELQIPLQAKLLRVIQERKYRKVGDTLSMPTNARIVAATHHNLFETTKEGTFRLDLLGRLSTFTLVTIPLRNRLEDLQMIVNSLDSSGKCYEEVFKTLPVKEFPFNVRDVQNLVRQWKVFGHIL